MLSSSGNTTVDVACQARKCYVQVNVGFFFEKMTY